MKRKLQRIHSPWRRFCITLLINTLLWVSTFRMSPRARVHWVGHSQRRRRLERPAVLLLFVTAILILEPHQYVYWAALIGGFASIYITMQSIYLLLPHKQRHHWIQK